MSELQPLIDLLAGKYGGLATVFTWMGAMRVAAKPISAVLQEGFSKAIAQAVDSDDDGDDKLVQAILGSRAYRLCAFLLDWIASVKLPTLKAYRDAVAAQRKP